MLDSVSLDQLRLFVAVVDKGSFSAAGRSLRRTQSTVSEAIATLEAHLGIRLFDRTGRYPCLTDAGLLMVADARRVLAEVDEMKARAKSISGGVESELSIVVDVFFPLDSLAKAAVDFQAYFPKTSLRIYVESLGATVEPVVKGSVNFGITGSLPTLPDGLVGEHLTSVRMLIVAAASHPLAAYPATIPRQELARHVQLVLADRSALTAGREYGVVSALNWRLADLSAKHTFLLNGLGWGSMPEHVVEKDIAAGLLVQLETDNFPTKGELLPLTVVYRATNPVGPAGRWMINKLRLSVGG